MTPGLLESLRDARIAETVVEPFDLSKGPLFRARLLKLNATTHVMVGGVHHIVSDKWSSGIFMRELTALYEAFLAGRPSPLERLPISYGEFARQERETAVRRGTGARARLLATAACTAPS